MASLAHATPHSPHLESISSECLPSRIRETAERTCGATTYLASLSAPFNVEIFKVHHRCTRFVAWLMRIMPAIVGSLEVAHMSRYRRTHNNSHDLLAFIDMVLKVVEFERPLTKTTSLEANRTLKGYACPFSAPNVNFSVSMLH